MGPLQTIIATLIASIVAGAVSLYLTNRKQRKLEEHKARLQGELEQSKLRMQNDLQLKFFEYQTRFSLLHQRQAEVIRDLYGMLGDAHEYIKHLVSPTFDPSDSKHAESTWAKYNTLAECYVKNRIYLEEETCKRMDELLLKMRMAMTKSSLGQRPEPGGRGIELWHEAWKSVSNEVPPILKELENQFRAFLKPKLTADDEDSATNSVPKDVS
jgi:hypothetical protein